MKFSESWLRSFVNPSLSTEQLTHMLTMAGLEVEDCEPVAKPFSNVVVAEVKSVTKHPDADRLSLCKVDVNAGELLNIVCGASNVAPGIKVPCAQVGAKLPGADKPFEIKLAKVRGVESQGMLCSSTELGLPTDVDGLLILPADAPIGMDFRSYADLDDHLITIKLTPNRADCLSLTGVARELAALTDLPLNPIEVKTISASIEDTFPVKIIDSKGCGRFAGRVIRNINAKAPTPLWMKQRMERAGLRCISALVDITNYVMLESGHPMHAYDLDKLVEKIEVRFARSGESITLLNQQTINLTEDILTICDAKGPISMAGIMGGDRTKAELDTKHVFLESAFFYPNEIAGRARRFNFSSDASHRFERGVDFADCAETIERATQLITDICGGQPGPVIDQIAKLPERKPVRMRKSRAQKVIGINIEENIIDSIFNRLQFSFEKQAGQAGEVVYVVTPPTYRFDLEIEEDLIEEVARLYGYENISTELPVTRANMRSTPEQSLSLHVFRQRLVESGYQETINYSFVDEQWEKDFANNENLIRLKNPIASQMNVMRSNLIGSLINNLQFNLNRKIDRVRIFEIGRVFLREKSATEQNTKNPLNIPDYIQPTHLATLAYGTAYEEHWQENNRNVDFFDIKGDLEKLAVPFSLEFRQGEHTAFHPGRSAHIFLENKCIGFIGELHPSLQQKYDLPLAPVLFEIDLANLQYRNLPVFMEVPKFPSVGRDIAIVVDDALTLDKVLSSVKGQLPKIVQEIRLFDLYKGKGLPEGKKSLAFRVLMQDTEKTLKDGDVDHAMEKILQIFTITLDAKLRN